MMEILEKIHVVKMRTQVLEIIISFMIPYSLTHLSRLLDNTHFIVCRNKTKTHWKKKFSNNEFTPNVETLRSFYMGSIVYCKEVQKQQTQRQTILKNKLS